MVATDEIDNILNGVSQAAGSPSDSYQSKLYDANGDLLGADDLPTTGYAGAWNGLAWNYSLVADRGHNSSGRIVGPPGSPIPSPVNILQNFWEDVLSSPLDSSTVEVQ